MLPPVQSFINWILNISKTWINKFTFVSVYLYFWNLACFEAITYNFKDIVLPARIFIHFLQSYCYILSGSVHLNHYKLTQSFRKGFIKRKKTHWNVKKNNVSSKGRSCVKIFPLHFQFLYPSLTLAVYINFPSAVLFSIRSTLALKSIAATVALMSIPSQLYFFC